MVRRLWVEGDVAGAGCEKVTDHAVHRTNHQVHVDRGGDAMLAQRRADHRADGQVGHVVVVHHVEMDDVRTGGEHVVHFFAQAGEIGGEDGGSDGERLHDDLG